MSLVEATEASIREARALRVFSARDEGAIAALLVLARKIDVEDAYFEALVADAQAWKGRPPSRDNVSLPTYFKACEQLGLTPSGRVSVRVKRKGKGSGGDLGRLRSREANRSS